LTYKFFSFLFLFYLLFFSNNESNDDFMIKKLEFTRVNALLSQQIEFLNKKIEDYSSTIELNQKRHEERLCK